MTPFDAFLLGVIDELADRGVSVEEQFAVLALAVLTFLFADDLLAVFVG